MSRTSKFLLVSLLALPLVAQDKPDAGGDGNGKAGLQAVDKESVQGKEEAGQAADGKGGKGAFALDKPPRVISARGQCRFDASVVPKRLMPGQAGTFRVTMILEGDAVMLSQSALQVKPAASSIPVAGWNLQPPTTARVAPFYAGQQVYDNWALLEAQVSMPTDARLGERRTISLELEFDLHHATTGQLLGRFQELVSLPCEVGLAAPPSGAPRQVGTARVEGAGTAFTPDGPAATGNSDGAPQTTQPANPSPSAADLADPHPTGSANPSQNEPEVATEPGLEAEGASPPGWLLGGGAAAAFLGVLFALLLRRRN